VHHALIGGVTAGLLWEVVRVALRWYFGTLSQVSVVYGSLTTSIVVLVGLDVAAALLLLGAQVIGGIRAHRSRRGHETGGAYAHAGQVNQTRYNRNGLWR